MGSSFYSAGLIRAPRWANALLTFLALTILGIEHAVLLALAVFVLCQVPTLGMVAGSC